MEALLQEDFETLEACPWCEGTLNTATFLYHDDMGCPIEKCASCGAVFAKKRLSPSGLSKYWKDWLSRVHLHDADAVEKRNRMYEIDFRFIQGYLPTGRVLDVGCGNGSFLNIFREHGYETEGVEFGEEAAAQAALLHHVHQGEFPELLLARQYDLVIFRGVLQYVPRPKDYLDKAMSLLNPGGLIFITAQPNMNSFCFKLFKNKFTQPVCGVDFIGYTEQMLSAYFYGAGFQKLGEAYFYEETPYASPEKDIIKVAEAIINKKNGGVIDIKSPSFYGNMMSLVYRKDCIEKV